MSRRFGIKPPDADGVVVTLIHYFDCLDPQEPPDVGSPVTLWVDYDCPIPMVCYLGDDNPVGVIPRELSVVLAEDFLWRGKMLACWVEASGYNDDVSVWVQVRIVGDIANDPRERTARALARAALTGDCDE